jgi:cytochrome o ubiquinol oxidase operon protein cyoD
MAHATGAANYSLKSYLTGFVLALVLTAIPFGLVASDALSRLDTLIVIAIAAVVQVVVHLHYFLHLDFSLKRRDDLVAIVFAGVVIVILFGGTLWIIYNLYYRMAI